MTGLMKGLPLKFSAQGNAGIGQSVMFQDLPWKWIESACRVGLLEPGAGFWTTDC
jgi:hypothetical protein